MGKVKDQYIGIIQQRQDARDILDDLLEAYPAQSVVDAMEELRDKMLAQ